MKKENQQNRWKNFHFEAWHFVFLLIASIILTTAVGDMKLKAMPRITNENSLLIDLTGKVPIDSISEEVSFVLFYNDSSDICEKMEYNINQLAQKENQGIKFYKINVDKHPREALKHNISGVPNTLILKNNKEVDRIMGIVSVSNLEMIYDRIIQ